MEDLLLDNDIRIGIAYTLIGTFALASAIAGVVLYRRARWRKLRLAGDPRAKQPKRR